MGYTTERRKYFIVELLVFAEGFIDCLNDHFIVGLETADGHSGLNS